MLISSSTWDRIRKPIISFFLVLNFGLILLYLSQAPVPGRIVDFFKNYFFFLGIAQNYGVFAPSPRQANLHLLALITYEDGTTKLYTFPRMDRMSLVDKLLKERYRKFLEDNVQTLAFPNLDKDVAVFAARQSDIFPDNHPKTVYLLRFMGSVPPIEVNRPNPPHSQFNILTTYEIREGDLK